MDGRCFSEYFEIFSGLVVGNLRESEDVTMGEVWNGV